MVELKVGITKDKLKIDAINSKNIWKKICINKDRLRLKREIKILDNFGQSMKF